jgi:Skp family chaperone for outer membrane proteins
MRVFVRWCVPVVMLVAVPAAAGNIGFLDAERAVATVKEGQKQMQAYEAWVQPRREQVEQLRARTAELDEQLKAQRSVASAEAVQELEQQFLLARREFEDAGRAFNREVEAKQDEFLGKVATQVGAVASEFAAANGFDAVFVLSAQPLVFVADAANITDRVVQIYDERYPVD